MAQVSPVNLTLSLPPSPAFHPHLIIDVHPPSPQSGQKDPDSSARSTNPSSSSCVLQLSFTFPDAIFLDRHEIPDSLYSTSTRQVQWDLRPEIIDIERAVLSSRQESAKRALSELDLGKHSDEGGSALSLLVIGTESSSTRSKGSTGERDAENLDPSVWYTVDLPLHARYLKPDESGYQTIEVLEDLRGRWVCSQGRSSNLDCPWLESLYFSTGWSYDGELEADSSRSTRSSHKFALPV
jgi:hypothetical protein